MKSGKNGVPRISVIVPVKDRRDLLRQLLGALEAQTYRDFEVVIVDDGSTDGSAEEAFALAARGLPVRVERTSGVGAVEARTLGVASSRGAFLAFTDSDCVPERTWLAEGVAALEGGADMAAGATVPVRQPLALERTVWEDFEDGLYASCNVFYRRAAYDAAGGFADAARRLGFRRNRFGRRLGFGEDTLLAWRIRRSGRTEFVPTAVVRHEVLQPSLPELLRRAWQTAGFPGLVRDVPELRGTLLRGRVWLGTRRVPLYGLVVAAALPWRRWLVPAAGVVWVAARARDAWRAPGSRKRRLAAVPIEMTVDVVTAIAIIAADVRARTVVL